MQEEQRYRKTAMGRIVLPVVTLHPITGKVLPLGTTLFFSLS